MIPILFSIMLTAFSAECTELEPLPDAIQVAWVSPVRQRVTGNEMIEVVHLQTLQEWLETESSDPKALLHQMGMLNQRSKKSIDPSNYKITIFDVNTSSLCRPIEQSEDNFQNVINEVSSCSIKKSGSIRSSRFGYTGCGYSLNTSSQTPGFDVYRISWENASTFGFCVFPLDRFLQGAPK